MANQVKGIFFNSHKNQITFSPSSSAFIHEKTVGWQSELYNL